MAIDKPFIGVYLNDPENNRIVSIAEKNKLTKTEFARACMRFGLSLFEKNSKEILKQAKLEA